MTVANAFTLAVQTLETATLPTQAFIPSHLSDKPDTDSSSARGWEIVSSEAQRTALINQLKANFV